MSFGGHTHSSLLGIYLEVELPGHRVGGMFGFIILLSYQNVWEFGWLYILSGLGICWWSLNEFHSGRCLLHFIVVIVVFPWWVIMLSPVSYACQPFICPLLWSGYSSLLSILLSCSFLLLICWHALHILNKRLIGDINYKYLVLLCS